MLCRKLAQLQPDASNVLVAAVMGGPPGPDALRSAMARLRRRAEADDPRVVASHGCRGRGDFLRRYERLSAALVRGPRLVEGEPVAFWDNPHARRPLPSRVRTALVRSHAGQGT